MTERFEKLVAERHAVKHAMACTSCTSALHLATMALGLGPGDEEAASARLGSFCSETACLQPRAVRLLEDRERELEGGLSRTDDAAGARFASHRAGRAPAW